MYFDSAAFLISSSPRSKSISFSSTLALASASHFDSLLTWFKNCPFSFSKHATLCWAASICFCFVTTTTAAFWVFRSLAFSEYARVFTSFLRLATILAFSLSLLLSLLFFNLSISLLQFSAWYVKFSSASCIVSVVSSIVDSKPTIFDSRAWMMLACSSLLELELVEAWSSAAARTSVRSRIFASRDSTSCAERSEIVRIFNEARANQANQASQTN